MVRTLFSRNKNLGFDSNQLLWECWCYTKLCVASAVSGCSVVWVFGWLPFNLRFLVVICYWASSYYLFTWRLLVKGLQTRQFTQMYKIILIFTLKYLNLLLRLLKNEIKVNKSLHNLRIVRTWIFFIFVLLFLFF